MLLPFRTSIRPSRMPIMNYAIIAVNVIVFLITYTGGSEVLRPFAQQWKLTPAYPFLWQFITYAFLHGSFMHIFGNMFFLYIFGNNVNDRLGNIGYLCFYLAGGIFSALGHMAAATIWGTGIATPVLGASGAVAAVIGAYLVLFPQTLITIVYWFFFIGTIDLPAFYLIIFKMIFLDNIITRSAANVAYDAHLAGYTMGILSCLLLLATGLLPSHQFDLWAMIRRWNLRRQYHSVAPDGTIPEKIRKKVNAKEVKSPQQTEKEQKIADLRDQIQTRISQANVSSAAELYHQLNVIDPEGILPRQTQLDIANQLMAMSDWSLAAIAYEKFLAHYDGYQHTEQVKLMLGVIYARYLNDSKKAMEYLTQAKEKISDPSQLKMCNDEIDRLKS